VRADPATRANAHRLTSFAHVIPALDFVLHPGERGSPLTLGPIRTFTPWFPHDRELRSYPSVQARAEEDGSTVVTLTYREEAVRFVFREAIAFYCVEESIFELSSIPGLPRRQDFLPSERTAPVWRSSVNFRRELYDHLELYRTGALLDSFMFFGQDYVVLVESIDSVDVRFDTREET
jgi:hypothetical protein